MIIETGLTDRHHARIFRQFAQWRDHVVVRFFDIRRMNADDREDVWIFLGQIDRAPAAFDRCADGDDARDAGFVRAAQHVVEIVAKSG